MKTFTFAELRTYWKDYETRKVLRVLKNGKWENRPAGFGMKPIDSTRAELLPLKQVKTFIEYLEEL